jgi:hypothetical protein
MKSKAAVIIPFARPTRKPEPTILEPTILERPDVVAPDGTHYAALPGIKLVKSRQSADDGGELIVQKVKDLTKELPTEAQSEHPDLPALALTPAGNIFLRGQHSLALLDHDLNVKSVLLFRNEEVLGTICKSEQNIFAVTTRRLLKLVWTGKRLSFNESDGGWESVYPDPSRTIFIDAKKRRPLAQPAF